MGSIHKSDEDSLNVRGVGLGILGFSLAAGIVSANEEPSRRPKVAPTEVINKAQDTRTEAKKVLKDPPSQEEVKKVVDSDPKKLDSDPPSKKFSGPHVLMQADVERFKLTEDSK